MEHALKWRLQVAAALLTLYLVWGSTYLAIRIGVADLPPALFAGIRFVIAGLIMTAYAMWQGHSLPNTKRDWKIIIIVGSLLLLGANGLVVWSEQWVPSNQTALIIAVAALWIAGLGALGPQGHPLRLSTRFALVFGFIGVIGLLIPDREYSLDYIWAQLVILFTTFLWSLGSVYSKRNRTQVSSLMSAAMQMLLSGIVFCIIGFSNEEHLRWNWTENAVITVLYLAIFGSCLAFSAYSWLIHEVSPPVLGTYAYINPIVAVLLGWLVLDETLNNTQLISMLVIIASVIMVSLSQNQSSRKTANRNQ